MVCFQRGEEYAEVTAALTLLQLGNTLQMEVKSDGVTLIQNSIKEA